MTKPIDEVLRINLDLLHNLLDQARLSAVQASAAMAADEHNLAIGTLLDLEHLLPESSALYATIMLLHRSRTGEAIT